ncbi:hypothetical protein BC831DRAFT_463943 [Entophlyctis helioformis]|nr:hypothetical protein BC831DRAFT_463943 [Entophlyctis helioformis]
MLRPMKRPTQQLAHIRMLLLAFARFSTSSPSAASKAAASIPAAATATATSIPIPAATKAASPPSTSTAPTTATSIQAAIPFKFARAPESALHQLLNAFDADQHHAAYQIFVELERCRSVDLKKIQPEHYAKLLDIAYYNRGAVLKDCHPRQRKKRVLAIYSLMNSLDIQPTQQAYETLIDTYLYLGYLGRIKGLIAAMEVHGCDTSTPKVRYGLMNSMVATDDIKGAHRVLNKLSKADTSVKPYNALLYSHRVARNELELLATFKEIKKRGVEPDAETFMRMYEFYAMQGNFTEANRYLAKFARSGLAMTPDFARVMLRASNDAGDYIRTLELVKEMRKQGQVFSRQMMQEEIVALSETGACVPAWKVFAVYARTGPPANRVVTAMARVQGPITNSVVIKELKRTIELHRLDQFTTLSSMMAGYRNLGDAGSNKIIYAALAGTAPESKLAGLHGLIVSAYSEAGDIPGAFAYARSQNYTVPRTVCFGFLVNGIRKESRDLDTILAYVGEHYPAYIKDFYENARARSKCVTRDDF